MKKDTSEVKVEETRSFTLSIDDMGRDQKLKVICFVFLFCCLLLGFPLLTALSNRTYNDGVTQWLVCCQSHNPHHHHPNPNRNPIRCPRECFPIVSVSLLVLRGMVLIEVTGGKGSDSRSKTSCNRRRMPMQRGALLTINLWDLIVTNTRRFV
jgi:hypothetical protein